MASSKPDGGKISDIKLNRVVLLTIAGFVLAIALGVYGAFRFVDSERQREMQAWQVRLGVVADSRAGAIGDWVNGSFLALRELAENASLQLYLTELVMSGGERAKVNDEAAQATYLRNLLAITAERSGFAAPQGGAVAANVERAGVAGIALTDAEGGLIVASPGFPALTAKLKTAILQAAGGQPTLIDLYPGATNLPTIGFALPVSALQSDKQAKGIGVVVGLRLVGRDFFERLKQPGDVATSAETYLVRALAETIEYLSPLADGTEPLSRTIAKSTPELADTFALEHPGGFGLKRDYLGREVLITARAIAGTPWTLVRKIGRAEALSESETRLRNMLIILLSLIGGMAIALFAVWRHGASVRAAEAAERFRVSAERMSNLSRFMKVVTNSQPTQIMAVTADGHYTFANEPAAAEAGLAPDDIIGKTMASVMGPIKAGHFGAINKDLMKEFEENPDAKPRPRRAKVHEFGENDGVQVIRSMHVPLRGDRDHPPSVLMVLDDITELTSERRRSERMLRQLTDTLVSVVDRRDPYSAFHSSRVAEVARAIAQEMEVPEDVAATVDISGNLMNLGKIFIPAELLTKTSNLTPDERKQLASSYLVSADLLRHVEFRGPVVETVRGLGEAWDGSGPLGQKGEDILLPARIISVANAFVGMVSPRAYREAMSFEQVSGILMKDSGVRYDRKVVIALINFLENRGGSEKWAHFRQPPPTATEAAS